MPGPDVKWFHPFPPRTAQQRAERAFIWLPWELGWATLKSLVWLSWCLLGKAQLVQKLKGDCVFVSRTLEIIYSWTSGVYKPSAGTNWSRIQKTTNGLVWREAWTNFITSCLLLSLYPQQEEKQNILFLTGTLRPACYTRGQLSPWEPQALGWW